MGQTCKLLYMNGILFSEVVGQHRIKKVFCLRIKYQIILNVNEKYMTFVLLFSVSGL